MVFVYILRCSDNTLYTGWTTDLNRRLKCHNSGKGSKYTRCRLPVKIVYYENLPDKSSALKRECEIKKLSRVEKLILIETKYK
jgi:putative endonuclease